MNSYSPAIAIFRQATRDRETAAKSPPAIGDRSIHPKGRSRCPHPRSESVFKQSLASGACRNGR
ncbi:MAG: hypothetical protein AB4040_00275 [Synechococcus sp.]